MSLLSSFRCCSPITCIASHVCFVISITQLHPCFVFSDACVPCGCGAALVSASCPTPASLSFPFPRRCGCQINFCHSLALPFPRLRRVYSRTAIDITSSHSPCLQSRLNIMTWCASQPRLLCHHLTDIVAYFAAHRRPRMERSDSWEYQRMSMKLI